MTFSDRIAAVVALGFNPRQAAFLTTVALHGGYCLRRQYGTFTGQKYGKTVCDFLDRLVDEQLATRVTFRADRGGIYHLFARRLYLAIGEENNRNRRPTTPAVIARKLMLLDFVLANRGYDWYATEREKRELLVKRLEVPETILPHRTYTPTSASGAPAVNTTRYLIQKLPIFLSGQPSLVNFVCVVVDPHATAIDAFIREHVALLCCLPHWALHAVVPRNVASRRACVVAYDRALAALSYAQASPDDVAWFERVREVVERGELRQLGVRDLQRYRELSTRVRVPGARFIPGALTVHELPHRYQQFGSLAGLS
jgi:hypothetical protein